MKDMDIYLSIVIPWAYVNLLVWTPQACKVRHFSEKIQNAEICNFFASDENLLMAHFFQNAVIWRQIKIFPWNQLQMATNALNFQWKKAEPVYLNPL